MTDYAQGKERPFWVGVDFDGTCVMAGEKFPEIKGDMPGAVVALREMAGAGGSLLLITSREGDDLKAAEKWFEERKIPLAGVNENPDPFWKGHRKIYCDILIDDRSTGFPLRSVEGFWCDTPDWEAILWDVILTMAKLRVQRVQHAMKNG